jgi:hypothetical protein
MTPPRRLTFFKETHTVGAAAENSENSKNSNCFKLYKKIRKITLLEDKTTFRILF